MSQSPSPSLRSEPIVIGLGSMDPRVQHHLRFTIEPYSARSDSYDLTYAFMQRDLNEMRERLEQVQNELSDLKNIVQNTNPPPRKPQRYPSPSTPIAMDHKDCSSA